MRFYGILIASMLITGCAAHRPTSVTAVAQPTDRPLLREAAATRLVETRYELKSYHDADDPRVRHEAHAIYRTTRVPARVVVLDTVPRGEFAPTSYAPLPPSAELAAEVAAQKQISAELRAIQARMADVEQHARTQLGMLADQTAETVNLRSQLEEEQRRVAELESKLQVQSEDASASPPPTIAPKTEPTW